MPNHITNCLTISHKDAEKIKWLLSCFAPKDEDDSPDEVGETLDFEKIIPPPANMFRGNLSMEDEQRCKREGIPTWYEWQTKNWGTKWNAYRGVIHKKEENKISIKFETAWAPPVPIFEKLEELGFEVNGLWKDEGDIVVHEIGEGEHEFYTNCEIEYGG